MHHARRRVLLKLSGEAFADPDIGYGISPETVRRVAGEIAEAQAAGNEIGIVVGEGTSSAACPPPPRGWIRPTPTTWGCWPR